MAWYHDPKIRALRDEWYAKLRKEGFHDIEGGMEGHLLQQRTPTYSLGAAATEMAGKLGHTKQVLAKTKGSAHGAHEHWLDQGVMNYYEKGKHNYYAAAEILATKIFLTNALRNLKISWSMHSDGYGEEVIAQELQVPRSHIRKYLRVLKERIKIYLDNTPET
jgi:hypothetical protein